MPAITCATCLLESGRMGRPPHNLPGALEKARRHVVESIDAEALRAAQATLLPLLGVSLDTTAEVVGRSRFWVSRARGAFMRGVPVRRRGGRRRSLVPLEEEVELVKMAVCRMTWSTSRSVRRHLRAVLERRTGQEVSESFLTDLLRRVAALLLPGGDASDFERVSHAFATIWRQEELILERTRRRAGVP